MATGFSKTTFNNLGTAPAIDATFLNTLQDFLVAIASGGAGSVVKADDADAVSAAGVGVASIPAMASNANNYKTGGIFYCASTITNAPFYGVKNANILVAPKDSNNVTQFAMSVDGSKAIKMRQCTSGTWTSWSDVGGGGSGAVNFLMNKLSENDLSSITNTGCTVTWDTTEDLSVTGSLKIEAAASGTGRKVEIDLSELSDAQITELCRLSFFYKLTVGADDSVEVYILNGSDKFYFDIPFLAANSGTLTKYDAAGMVTNRTGNKLVFGFKDNSAATVYLGDALLTPRVLPHGAVISEWQDYSLVITATTTNPTPGTVVQNKAQWRRVGSHIEIRISYETSTAGSPGSGTYMFSLPPGIEADTTKFPTINAGSGLDILACGIAYLYNTTPNNCITAQVAPYSAVAGQPKNKLVVYAATSFAPYSISAVSSGHFSMGSAIRYHISASFPISGWTSSINLVTEAQEFAFNTQASVNVNDTTSFGYGDNGTPILNNTATTYYDVLFKSNIQASDLILVEVRHKATGRWINSQYAEVPSIFTTLARGAIVSSTSGQRGVGFTVVDQNKVRVYFMSGLLTSNSYATDVTTFTRAWSSVTSASDGYDRWRVRKISNGNMAEAPASGIYESGQNANGYYVKYVDGTMECWFSEYYQVPSVSSFSRTWTFPASFAEIPTWIATCSVDSTGYQFPSPYAWDESTSALTVSFYEIQGRSINLPTKIAYHAIGKWNLSRSVAAPGTPVGASTVFVECKKTTSYGPPSLQPFDFSEVVEDALGCVTTGSNWKFTAPVSGLYLVQVTATLGATTTAYIYKNGVQGQPFGTLGSTTAFNHFPFSATIRLSQGDYIDIRMTYTTALVADRRIQITRLSA